MMRLGEIVRRLDGEGLLRAPLPQERALADIEVRAVTSDSRAVEAGTLFCAVRGTAADGHRFLSAAAAAGAVAALVEDPDGSLPLPQIRVTDGRLAVAVAAAQLFRDPWYELTLVGITGTNGKTTSAAILRHLLGLRAPTASIGTLGVVGADGAVAPGTEGLTTPGPVEFARWLRELRDGGVRSVAMEVSSHALDQGRVAAGRFDAALLTNLSRDHLDYHPSMDAYREAKLRLLDRVKPDGAVVVNVDDPAWAGVRAPAGTRLVSFGTRPDAMVRAERLRVGPRGMEWDLHTPDGGAGVLLPIFGLYNVSNALGVAAVLWGLGWGAEEVAAGLESLPQVPGRLERVPGPAGAPTVLIDFAHTPDALEGALAAVRPLVPGRLIAVFGAGGDRDRGKRPEMGRAAAAGADFSVVTSDNPRTENPDRILDDVESGMGNAPRRRVVDRRQAIRDAISMAGGEDLILLAGKGHETYQIRGTEKLHFDERLVVRDIFAEREAGE